MSDVNGAKLSTLTGALAIAAGGAVADGFGIISSNADSSGMVSVSGAGSTWALLT